MAEAVRDYEAILIVHPDLNAEAIGPLQAQFGEMVTRLGGRVVESAVLGRRKLSYRMGKYNEGNYLEVKLQLPPESVEGLKRSAALMESLIRMMIVQGTGAPAPLFRSEAHGSESEV